MSTFLGDEWLSAVEAELAEVAPVDAVDAVVQYVVTGGPDGKIQAHLVIDGGQVTAMAGGKHPDPGCTITSNYVDAAALFNGELRPEVAFMTGQVKVEGDHRIWLLDLMPFRRSADVQSALAGLRDTTIV